MADSLEEPIKLAGSRRAIGDAVFAGEADPRQEVVVTVHLKNPSTKRRRTGSAVDLADLMEPITRRALAHRRAAEYATAAEAIGKYASASGLGVREVDLTRRCIVLSGTVERLSKSFGASLRLHQVAGERFLGRIGPLVVPRTIAPWTRAVLGLDHRPHVRRRLENLSGDGTGSGLWPTEVAALYDFPLERDASGQTIGIIALGGGYERADLMHACQRMGRPVPLVVEQSVGGATNSYGGGTPADQELALDMQVIAGVASSASIVVYFADNRIENVATAIHQAAFDNANRPQVLTLSWGSAEKFWHDDVRQATQAALQDAIRLRISVVATAGDDLATCGLLDGEAHVFFPASSPYVLGCGGTRIGVAGGGIVSEEVWNE